MASKKLGSTKATDLLIVTSVNLAADVGSSILPTANGGTGFGSFVDGDLLLGKTAGNTLQKLAKPSTDGLLLTYDSASGLPVWRKETITDHLLAPTDNTYDIGASGATRPRSGYFGTSVFVGASNTKQILSNASEELTLSSSAGTGSIMLRTGGSDRWKVDPSGHLLAATDASFDIGSNAANRPRDIYASGRTLCGTFRSARVSTAGVLNNTATTVYTFPASGDACYFMWVYIDSADTTNYAAYALVVTDTGSRKILQQFNGAKLVLSLTGANLQVVQTSGVTQTVVVSFIKLD